MKQRIMTFNLRMDTPEDKENSWPNRKELVSTVINKYDPLIFGTQEGTYPMLQDLEGLLPKFAFVGEGRDGAKSDEFCAIFYKKESVKIINSGTFWLSETPDIEGSKSWNTACPRICTWVHFFLRDFNEELLVFNTHLDHISAEARERGIVLIYNKILKMNQEKILPTILMGDFNSTPESNVVQLLRGEKYSQIETPMNSKESLSLTSGNISLIDCFSNVNDIGCTAHSFTGKTSGLPIDYIFVSEKITILKTLIVKDNRDQRYPSDHYPVMAELSID